MSKPLSLLEFQEMQDLNELRKGILVMDGDWLVFQAMAASEVETDWGDDMWTLECDHAKAWSILCDSIKSYASRKKAWLGAPIVLAFTHDDNWRKGVLPTYKDNRKKTRKPVGYRAFLERVWENEEWFSIREDRLEGDDVMGIIGSDPALFGFKKAVLVSCDKDFKTIPHCDFLWCTTGNILSHSLAEADYWHTFQMIKGDITDGYTGIGGWGDTAAEYLENPFKFVLTQKELKSGKNKGTIVEQWVKEPLAETDTLWDGIVSLGAKAGMTPADIIVQGQVARILRASEYDWYNKEITLWEPSRSPSLCSFA